MKLDNHAIGTLWQANGKYFTVTHYGNRSTRRALCGVRVINTGYDTVSTEVDCKRCLTMLKGKA